VSSSFQFPDNYADDPTLAHILEQLRSDDPSPILVTGEAGTGKSTLVNYIRCAGRCFLTFTLYPNLLDQTLSLGITKTSGEECDL